MPLAVGWIWLIGLLSFVIGFGLFKFKAMKTLIGVGALLVTVMLVALFLTQLGFGATESLLERFNIISVTVAAAGGYLVGSFLSWITG